MLALSATALAAAACTYGSGDDVEARAVPRETLLLGTQAGPLVVQVPSGSVLFDRPGTVASLGGSWLLSATPSAGSTLLETIDGVGRRARIRTSAWTARSTFGSSRRAARRSR